MELMECSPHLDSAISTSIPTSSLVSRFDLSLLSLSFYSPRLAHSYKISAHSLPQSVLHCATYKTFYRHLPLLSSSLHPSPRVLRTVVPPFVWVIRCNYNINWTARMHVYTECIVN